MSSNVSVTNNGKLVYSSDSDSRVDTTGPDLDDKRPYRLYPFFSLEIGIDPKKDRRVRRCVFAANISED